MTSILFRLGKALSGATLLVLISACAVGPDYQRPALDVGTHYKEAGLTAVDGGNATTQGWVVAQPADEVLRGDWWTVFHDPVLDTLMHASNADNFDIARVEAQYRQAQALLQSSRSGFFPTLGTGAGVTRSGSGSGSGDASAGGGAGIGGPSNLFSLTGNVSWEVDLWGKIRRSVESSQAGVQASLADVATTRLSMQSTLAQTYFRLRIMDNEKRLLAQTLQAYERSLTMTQNRYQAGVAAQAEVAVSQAQLENTRVQALALNWQRAQLEHALAVLTGQAPAAFSLAAAESVAYDMQLAQVPVIPIGLPAQLLQRRPDVAAAERRTAQANASIGVAQAAWFPDLTLSAQGGFRSGQWAQWLSSPASFWSLGPALALAIFDGGAREANVASMRAAYDAQAATYRQTVLTALREVEDYLIQRHVLDQEQDAQTRALAAARLSLELTRNQYEAGLIDYLSVVQVETTALSTERAALSLLTDRLIASVQLIAALGGGWHSESVSE
ncbi:MAG: efflux transporter outer membrane subunit [Burkholderiaceae bacterium]|nr:efflux transporter outer membrane subunit [Burkholderiaceae bacterium]